MYNEEVGREDFEALGGLTRGDDLYLDTLKHRDGEPDMRRRREWFRRGFGHHGGMYGWLYYLGLSDSPEEETGDDNGHVPHSRKRFDLLVYAVACTTCEAKPLQRCRVVVSEQGGRDKATWAFPHAARQNLAAKTYNLDAAA